MASAPYVGQIASIESNHIGRSTMGLKQTEYNLFDETYLKPLYLASVIACHCTISNDKCLRHFSTHKHCMYVKCMKISIQHHTCMCISLRLRFSYSQPFMDITALLNFTFVPFVCFSAARQMFSVYMYVCVCVEHEIHFVYFLYFHKCYLCLLKCTLMKTI